MEVMKYVLMTVILFAWGQLDRGEISRAAYSKRDYRVIPALGDGTMLPPQAKFHKKADEDAASAGFAI